MDFGQYLATHQAESLGVGILLDSHQRLFLDYKL